MLMPVIFGFCRGINLMAGNKRIELRRLRGILKDQTWSVFETGHGDCILGDEEFNMRIGRFLGISAVAIIAGKPEVAKPDKYILVQRLTSNQVLYGGTVERLFTKNRWLQKDNTRGGDWWVIDWDDWFLPFRMNDIFHHKRTDKIIKRYRSKHDLIWEC